MRVLIICLLGGFILGLFLATWFYGFYITHYPNASDMEKGIMGMIAFFVFVVGGTYV